VKTLLFNGTSYFLLQFEDTAFLLLISSTGTTLHLLLKRTVSEYLSSYLQEDVRDEIILCCVIWNACVESYLSMH